MPDVPVIDQTDIANEYQEFAYIVSHDLNAPLRHIREFTRLLIDARGDSDLSADEQDYVQFLNSSLDRLDIMQKALLEFSRVQTHGAEFGPIDAMALVEAVLGALSVKDMDPAPFITYANLPDVYGDSGQIFSVFSFLINNSLKFCHPDRPIEIFIVAVEGDKNVTFEIRDNGIGVPAQNAEDVFKLFRRLHAGDAYGGAGAGLTLARKIIERHAGKVWVDGEVDEGAKVCFTLPVAPKD